MGNFVTFAVLNFGRVHKFLKYFEIPASGLKQGKHQFDFEINKEFFSCFDFEDFEDVGINVQVEVDKSSTMMIMEFWLKGYVSVHCDLCGDLFNLPLETRFRLIAKFSEAENSEDDEVILIPHNESRLNLSQYLYEFVLLSVPVKRKHPDGECDPEVLEKLQRYLVTPILDEEDEDDEDEREEALDNKAVWELLRNIKNDN